MLGHISQSGASPFVIEVALLGCNQHPRWGSRPGQLASGRYPRQREYPHPPPPSRNNTRRTINSVVISHLFSIQCNADWRPKPNVCEHKVETRGSRKLLGAGFAVSIRQEVLKVKRSGSVNYSSTEIPLRPYLVA